MADAIRTFGPMQNALMDIVTSVYLAMQEGANAFLGGPGDRRDRHRRLRST
jgi:hypothetical protein